MLAKDPMKGIITAALATAALGFGLAACGSDSSSSSSSSSSDTSSTAAAGGDAQATAKAAVDEAKKVPEFGLKAEPFDASKAKGMTIFNIPVSSTIPYVASVDKQMQKLAKERGIKWVQYENQGTPTEWASGINQAITQKADIIILDAGLDPQLVLPGLKRAKAAGVKVLVNHLYENGTAPTANVLKLIDGYITVPFHRSGELSVQYAVAEDGCDGVKSAVIINAKEVPPSQGIVDAMVAKAKELCPDANPKVINVPVVDWGTKIAPQVQSALTGDPSIKWILPIYDSMAIPAVAGIRAAGKSSSVRVASYNGTPDVLKLIQDGDIMAAEQGENIQWLAYANMDQAMRILTDGPVIKDGLEDTPLRLFDDSNVAEAGAPEYIKGFGDSYITGYKKLWGEG